MKITNLFATTAMAAVLAAGAVSAQNLSSSYGAGVSLLSPEQTGFLYAGTTEVTGQGSGATVITPTTATFSMTGFANSSNSAGTDAAAPEATAKSGVLTTFNFDRTVTASGSAIGLGRVVAQGAANASVGAVGSAFGETLAGEIRTIVGPPAGTRTSSSNAASESAASLIGDGTTSVLAGLIGTGSGFVGTTGTSVTSTQAGIAYSGLNAIGSAAGTGINIAGQTAGAQTFAVVEPLLAGLAAGQGNISFGMALTAPAITLAVANVGGGTISLGATTGGFFGGGAATNGTAGFASIFTP